jgi:hypothetical protein
VPTHSVYRMLTNTLSETPFGFLFHHPNDTDREIILTGLAFDVPRMPS